MILMRQLAVIFNVGALLLCGHLLGWPGWALNVIAFEGLVWIAIERMGPK